MRVFLIVVIVIHGLIHFMGFIKAFHIAEMDQLTQNISKPLGILWLFSGLLFFALLFFISANKDWWWMPAIVAIGTSQFLIFLTWQDAKFGTIPNLLIFIAIILGFALWNFNIQTNKEIHAILSQSKETEKTVVSEQMLAALPSPVQKWLTHTGIVGKEKIRNVYLKQTGLIKLKPDQKNWSKAEAEQYITTDKPAFLWKVNMSIMPLVNVTGRDLFMNGEGQMKVNLASLIPVVNVANNEKIDQSSLQRFLLELPLYPSAAMSPYVTWESIDDHSAAATMTYQGVTGSATFFFDDHGDFLKSSALRYKDSDESAQLIECIGEVKRNSIVNGIKIPTQIDVSWMLEAGKFTWYKLEIYDVVFNK
ncbi:DUF6920 family protein [Effusibacillus lacus]|uniref:Uncharacterized protein n=1 Tax=Effusibacillus lacus TaxID=1348429 RepID=A0A292YMS3_9BACL|nr:DUF6544 family protein [Effusibacillus lacus]TCS72323.1 hypothetical protein EDD64_12276 [Effusibacillus lacus]GAX90211.1 hypothetical protein EFBL_1837 [Effusibacillus lacus]